MSSSIDILMSGNPLWMDAICPKTPRATKEPQSSAITSPATIPSAGAAPTRRCASMGGIARHESDRSYAG